MAKPTKHSGLPAPEILYRRYRETRRVDTDEALSNQETVMNNVSASGADADAETSAESVYKQYQHSRLQDHSRAIDAVLKEIQIDAAKDQMLQQLVQSESQNALPKSQSAGTIAQLFALPGRMLDGLMANFRGSGANHSSPVFRVGLPAAMAASVALAVIPFIVSDKSAQDAGALMAAVTPLSESLFDSSSSMVKQIEPVSIGTVGFSSSASPETHYFNLGFAITDLALTTAAGSDQYQEENVARFNQLATSIQKPVIKSAINELVASLGSDDVSVQDVTASVDGLNQSIENNSDGLYQLYQLGQSLEALNLSAGLFIDGQNSDVLESALKNHHVLFPAAGGAGVDPRINALLKDIRLAGADRPLTLDDARGIDNAISKILLLMN